MAGDVFTTAGSVLEAELRADHDRIDRGIVRCSTRYRPDWTGVRWNVYFRASWKVDGETVAWEEKIGLLPANATQGERKKVQDRLDAIRERVLGILEELDLEVRSATHSTPESRRYG